MNQPLANWHINQDATDEEAYEILMQDHVWNSFALADLEPPLREYSQFVIASQEKSDERAICLILHHPIIVKFFHPLSCQSI